MFAFHAKPVHERRIRNNLLFYILQVRAKLEPYNVQKVTAMTWNPPTSFSFSFLLQLLLVV